MSTAPRVLFVCVKNGGTSQMAAGLMRRAAGGEATLDPVDGTPVEVWEIDEPSLRGIEGMERMRLVRDDIAARVARLAVRLGVDGLPGAP